MSDFSDTEFDTPSGDEAGTGTSNPINGLIDPATSEKIRQVSGMLRKAAEAHGADKLMLGGGIALLLGGATLYLTNQGKRK